MLISYFYSPSLGGVETHLDDLTRYLAARGYRTFVSTLQSLTSPDKARVIERSENLTVYRAPNPLQGMFYSLQRHSLLRFVLLTPLLALTTSLIMAFHRREIGVVHGQEINSSLIVAFICRLFGRRSVLTLHSIVDALERDTPGSGAPEERVLSGIDNVLAISRRMAEGIASTELRSRVRQMTYWLDLGLFAPRDREEAKNAMGFGDYFVVLFAGRLVEVKGVDVVLEMCRNLRHLEKIRFVIAGTGPMEGKVRKAASELGNLHYAGGVRRLEMIAYYNMADVVIVPSLYEEAFGRVIMEAAACGTPVIGSDRGAIPEVITPDTGIVTEPTAASFSKALMELFEDPERLRTLACNCRRHAEEAFSTANASVIEEAYGWSAGQ